VSFGRNRGAFAPIEEDLGRWGLHGREVSRWCKEQGGWELEIVERSSADTEGFAILPRKWIVERTLGWLMRSRRLSKDYERLVQTSETFIEVAMIRLILSRLARGV